MAEYLPTTWAKRAGVLRLFVSNRQLLTVINLSPSEETTWHSRVNLCVAVAAPRDCPQKKVLSVSPREHEINRPFSSVGLHDSRSLMHWESEALGAEGVQQSLLLFLYLAPLILGYFYFPLTPTPTPKCRQIFNTPTFHYYRILVRVLVKPRNLMKYHFEKA